MSPQIDQKILDASETCQFHKTKLKVGAYGNYCIDCWSEMYPPGIPKEEYVVIHFTQEEMEQAERDAKHLRNISKGFKDEQFGVRRDHLDFHKIGTRGEIAMAIYLGVPLKEANTPGKYRGSDLTYNGIEIEVKTNTWWPGGIMIRDYEDWLESSKPEKKTRIDVIFLVHTLEPERKINTILGWVTRERFIRESEKMQTRATIKNLLRCLIKILNVENITNMASTGCNRHANF